jgi:predicted dehydrogenase
MKTVVVGAGRMGRRHAKIVQGLNFDLIGIADPVEQARHLAIEECDLNSDKVFSDADSMIESLRPELVIVSTTSPTHAYYTLMAAERGVRYILCEKPMATSLADCDRMISACNAHGVRLAINHQMRFMAQYQIPKDLATSEAVGGLTSITVVAGNIGLSMNGAHYFEMLRFLTG